MKLHVEIRPLISIERNDPTNTLLSDLATTFNDDENFDFEIKAEGVTFKVEFGFLIF
jgi:hypothetical protein